MEVISTNQVISHNVNDKKYALVAGTGEGSCSGCAFQGQPGCLTATDSKCISNYELVWKEVAQPEFDTFGHKGVFFGEMVANLVKPGADILETLTPEKVDLWHVAAGLAGEAGEVLDEVKKHVVFNKPFDMAKVIKELGDVEFYLEGVRQNIGISREQVLAANIEKLVTGPDARYKDGYSDKAANTRAEKQ